MNPNKQDCQSCRDWILESEAGENCEKFPQEVVDHLAVCGTCRAQQEELQETLSLLGSLEDVDPPRHFFVYEKADEVGGWKMWWNWLISPQTLAAGSSLALLLVVGLLVSGLRVRTDGASLTLGLGTLPVLAEPRIEPDPEMLRADFRRILAEEMSARDRQVLSQVKVEISSFGDRLEEARKQQFEQVMTSLDTRLEENFSERDEVFSENLRLAALEIYQTLSTQQRRGLLNLNARLERMEETGQIQGTQTQALMATVMQLAQRYE